MPDQSTDEDVRASGATPSGYIRADDVAGLAGALRSALGAEVSILGCSKRGAAALNAIAKGGGSLAGTQKALDDALVALSGGQHG